MDKAYSFNEIGLLPSTLSQIKHRGDINILRDEKLPIFVSPMTCVLDKDNFDTFNNSKVIPIYPVKFNDTTRFNFSKSRWVAMTLVEFKHWFNECNAEEDVEEGFYKILIDTANGHMEELYSCVEDAKQEYGNKLTIMIGNIANPATYIECCISGVDYVRVGIGGGNGCTTSVQTGIHTSLPWLLTEINKAKQDFKRLHLAYTPTACTPTKVVADGGIDSIDKAIKALALGADYVMMGRCFAECKESCGIIKESDVWNGITTELKEYYGQSSRKGQIDRFGKVVSNPEGCETLIQVKTSLLEFESKFEAALRSAMSYCNAKDLDSFIGRVSYNIISLLEFHSYNK